MSPELVCKRFGYPAEVLEHLTEICRILQIVRPVSVLLTGSTARGELSYCRGKEGSLSLFSDYEFIVLTSPLTTQGLKKSALVSLRCLERKIGSESILFHIDVAWVDATKLGGIPRTFRLFEDKSCGITLLGDDVRQELPEVTLETLDYAELNEILIWRLWALLLYLPVCLLDSDVSCSDELYSFVLARNALDLGTWVLPHDGALVSSFRARLTYIKEHFRSLPHCRSISPDFGELLEVWALGKFEFIFPSPTKSLYADVFHCFQNAVEMREGRRQPGVVEARFNDWSLRRKAFEGLVMWKGRGGPFKGLRWLFRRKYALQLDTLLDFHRSVLAYLKGDGMGARVALARVNASLYALLPWRCPVEVTDDFVGSFSELRYRFAEFLMEYSRSVGSKREYLNEVLGRSHG